MLRAGGLRRILTVALVLGASSGALAADNGGWSVSKSSGEVWIATTGADQVSLHQQEVLNPGDTIRTGRNGRVLLMRGEETILIAPNSVVGLPVEKTDGLQTTILQQAGSILLDVEKRNVQHFEVETPYLAAVVKGTQFRVTVNAASTSVEVNRGQVEVSDFKSGQIAQVLPGQAATASAHGKTGLALSGSGAFIPIEQGKPRASSIDRVPVPRDGLHAPHNAANGKIIHALGTVDTTSGRPAPPLRERQATGNSPAKRNVIRISASLGEVKLNVQKATHGLAHGSVAPGSPRNASGKDTVWSDAKASASSASTASQGNSTSSGNAATAATAATTNGTATSAATASTIAAATGSANNSGTGISSGATGNGKGGNGNNGNGNGNGNNGNGNGNGNNGNGNGNGNNGNGNSNGNNGKGKTK